MLQVMFIIKAKYLLFSKKACVKFCTIRHQKTFKQANDEFSAIETSSAILTAAKHCKNYLQCSAVKYIAVQ